MYRLLKAKGVHLASLPELTSTNTPAAAKFTISQGACELCSQFGVISKSFVREQSTHTNPSVVNKKPRKKRTRSNTKHVEMLEVTNSSTSERKATIRNLKPNEIKLLAMTNFNLNELYKLKDFVKSSSGRAVYEHTYNNLTDINNIPYISIPEKEDTITPLPPPPILNPVISDKFITTLDNLHVAEVEKITEAEIEAEAEEMTDEVLQSVKECAFQPETIEEEIVETDEVAKEEEPKKFPRRNDGKAREEVVTRTLAAYIQTCVSLKTPQRGLNALHFHRHRVAKYADRFPPLKSIVVYNELLKGFAARGDYPKLREVLRIVEEEGCKLNVQSYAAVFECLGRVHTQGSYVKVIKQYADAATAAGISFSMIINNATFLYDQREKVVLAMKAHDKNFEPTYDAPSVQFMNHLVDHLNADEQLAGLPETVADNTGVFTREMLSKAIKKQMEIEKNVSVTVRSIEPKPKPTEEVLKFRQAWTDHMNMWEEAASLAFHRDLAALTAQRSATNLEPYFRSIPVKDFIAIITDEAQKMAQGSETYSPTVAMLYKDLGGKVYARYKVLKKQKAGVLDKINKIHNKYCENYADSHTKLDVLPGAIDYLNPRQKWQWAEHCFKHEGATILMDHQEWVPTTLVAIGKFLYNIVMHDLKVDVNSLRNNSKHKNYLPAFYTIFRNQGRIVKEEVKPHPILSKLYRASVPETLTFPAYELPMCCPPVPWTSVQTGGYLVAPCEVVRLPSQATMQKQRLRDATPNELYPSLDALNQLGSIPWKVNQNLLDVILEVFKNGGSAKLDVPEPPASLTPPPPIMQEMEKQEKFAIFRQKLQYRRKKAEMYSLWCDCLYRLSLANHFRDDIFWLPHNMDFRGRVYPVPPHLNHLGSDLARSMLVFAESRPLGPDGLNWLKLHLVNLTGLKKRDRVEDRLKYADEIMDKILDSADNPLTGEQWWAESDEPWQTLACCMEIATAQRSPDPEKFESHFPVHQDGSCNGLQHYAALGRDGAGAFSVNLCPSPIPQDVYSAVAVLVEEKRQSDAEKGLEIAKILDGFVKRKVIKQTVMTTVYGVTRFGARLQIARQLKDIDEFPKDSVWSGSSYLTGRTFESLRTMFTSTREIQDWFTECARLISSVCGENVEWITPMGLPIVQPYFRYKRLYNNGVYESFHMDKYEKPNVMKQKNAFPPNFIHSLDSSHMMLTSLHCERAGITFVSVHDCYWTHPSTVHIMNKYCREQFVALHSEPILENLSTFLCEKYSYLAEDIADDGSVTELSKRKLNRLLRKLPKTGKFDINEVLNSVYFFS